MWRRRFLFLPVTLSALLAGVFLLLRSDGGAEEARPTGADLSRLLGGSPAEGFARALPPADIRLPRDHGPHPEFRTEWWYFTGNLTADGEGEGEAHRFGYQLTFFRSALNPPPEPGRQGTATDPWTTQHLFMAHLAVTEIPGAAPAGRFHHRERFARGGTLGLAGVEMAPSGRFRVWLGPWSAASVSVSNQGDIWPLRLLARDLTNTPKEADLELDLIVEPTKPVVLQGDAGYSRKGKEPGNASYYYTFPRLATKGRLRIGEASWAVSGSSWLDREWSTGSLGEGQVGWDWFALQLDDGREVMLYQLRRADGSAGPYSSGVLVEADGTARPLAREAFSIEVQERWRTRDSGAVYPAAWRLEIRATIQEGDEALMLTVRPTFADQELHAAVRYWEGSVEVTGDARGRGYVELTGYATGAE